MKKYWIIKVLVNFTNRLEKKHRFLNKVFKVIYFSTIHFLKNKCFLRASSLTYYSLMAIVPFFALIFGIGKVFGYQKYIEIDILDRFSEQKELINEVIKFANNLLVESKGGVIALLGVLFLFWSLIKLLSHIESALNSIWRARRRKVKNMLGLYISLLFLIPIFLVVYSSLKVYFTSFFIKEVIVDTFIERFYYLFIKISPYVLVWALFSFMFFYMPNANIHLKSAMFAGFISGSAYLIIQYFYVHFQVGFTKYNAIYGSFTALPLFLIWLQLSWLVFLYGAEISYTFQNVNKLKIHPKR